MYTQLDGSEIKLLNAGDRTILNMDIEGKSEQIVTSPSTNICPPPTDPNWVFTGDAYVDDDGNLQLPTLGDTAYIILPWGKRANTLNIAYTLVFGGGLYLSTGYLDDEKNKISGNGYAIVDKEDNYSSSTNFGGANEYGDALTSAAYITLTFMRGDVYGTNPYAVTNLSISISAQDYTPFIPASPNPRYPSEIKSVGAHNEETGNYEVEIETSSENIFNSRYAGVFYNNNTVTKNGITATMISDGVVHLKGTSSDVTYFNLYNISGDQQLLTKYRGKPVSYNTCDGTFVFGYFKEDGTSVNKLNSGDTIPDSAYSMRAYFVINNNVTIDKIYYLHMNIGTTLTKFQPYYCNRITYILREPLRSLPSGYCDTLHITSNKIYVYRQTGSVVFNGTEDWQAHATAPHTFKLSMGTTIGRHGAGRCTHFKSIISSQFGLQDGVYDTYTNSVYVTHMDSITVDDFKTWLSNNNVQLDYELLNPYVEELDQFNKPTTCEGTNYVTVNDTVKPNIILEYFKGFSDEDKQAIKDGTIAVQSKIIVKATDTLPEIVLTEDDSIKDWEYSDERYVPQQGFIGQFVARTLSGNLQDISDDFNIENREIELQLGIVHLGTNETTWYTFGNFLVTNPEGNEVTDNTKFEAMDYTKLFNKDFNGDFTNDMFPESYNSIVFVDEETKLPKGSVTALWLARYTCEQAGVEFGQNSFTNSDYVIDFNPYQAGETCRDVMKDIAKLAFSWVRIDVDNRCYIDFKESDETYEDDYNIFTNDEYYSLETKKEVYGPINRVYIGMSNIDGESIIVAEDEEDIATNGEKPLYIYDNQLTYSPELRALIADNGSANKLLGLTYTHLTTETIGHPWLLGKEFITVLDMEDNECKTYPFNKILKFNGHIKSTIDSMGESEVEATLGYESDVVKNAKNAMVLVKKHEGEIELLTTDVTNVQDNIKDNYYTKEDTNKTISNATSGLTNIYSSAGGNNRFRNTGLHFKEGTGFEYWDGIVDVVSEINSATQTAMLLQNGSISQIVSNLPNGKYTISFKHEELIESSSAYVLINSTRYDLAGNAKFEQTIDVSTNSIEIEFNCDTNGGFKIYELMGNVGETALVWTQHPDEIMTDTVNISKGITITSSKTDAIFKAGADGIRIENTSKNTTTEFLENGMSTNDAEIKGQAKVSGALFTKVGNQTWISGI